MVDFVTTPIAIGELFDKITILEIKAERVVDPAKLANVRRELGALQEIRDRDVSPSDELTSLSAELKGVNEEIWDLEDLIRDCERRGDFTDDFIAVARRIYRTNDRRAAVKRKINMLLGSTIIEEKSYGEY